MARKGNKKVGDWSWVDEVESQAQISDIHRRRAAGLEGHSQCPFNPYPRDTTPSNTTTKLSSTTNGTITNGIHDLEGDSNGSHGNRINGHSNDGSIKGRKRKSRSNTVTSNNENDDIDDIDDNDDIVLVKDSRCQPKRCSKNPRCYNHYGAEEVLKETKEEYLEKMLPAISAKREEGKPAGLKNLGATCYANAFLQVWFRNVKFRNGVYAAVQSTKTPLYHLAMIFASLQYSERAVVDPAPLLDSLGLKKTDQQDAAEFSKLFTSLIADAFARQPDPKLKSLINDMFEGKMEHSTRCSRCKTISSRTESFLELDLNFKNNDRIEECLERSFIPEKLNGDNQYRCQKCDSLQDATRSSKPAKLPPVLNLSLMRFKYTTSGRVKNKATIKYGKELVVEGTKYRLCAAVIHVGSSALHGHFKCNVYDNESDAWIVCNDEEIEMPSKEKRRKLNLDGITSDGTVSCDSVYMLVYKRDEEGMPDQPAEVIMDMVMADDKAFKMEMDEVAVQKEILDDEFGHIRGAQKEVIRYLPGTERIIPASLLQDFLRADKMDQLFKPANNDLLTCYHEQLDPGQGSQCLLISSRAFKLLETYYPGLQRREPCSECVAEAWARLRESSVHLDNRLQFDELNVSPQEYILPKAWLSAWRKGDSPSNLPNHPSYGMFCEHGNRFEDDSKNQIPISAGALALLHSLVGDFPTLRIDAPICSTCAESRVGDTEALEIWQAQVKEEKGIGKSIKAHSAAMVFKQDFYAIPGSWWREWQLWTKNPLQGGGKPRLDMGVCEHGGLDWDPRMEWPKWVDEKGWGEIKRRYGPDLPDVVVQFGSHPLPGKRTSVIDVSPPVCEVCCKAKSLQFDSTIIHVVFEEEGKNKTMGSRRGTRIKGKAIPIEVEKTTTMKDIKIEICAAKGISPISQLLRYKGRELDSSETVETAGIGKEDEIYCEELEETEMDLEVGVNEGFGGTALVGALACPQCTLNNPPGSASCEACDYPFIAA